VFFEERVVATAIERRAALLLSATMLCYACNHVIGRAVHADLPPLGLSFWRWLCGALILLPFIFTRLPTLLPRYVEHWRILALLGVLIVGSTSLVLVGLNLTSATNTSLINASQPTITALLTWILLGDKLHRIQWLGVVMAFGGIAFMMLRGDWRVLLLLDFNAGDLVILLAMFGFATYAINIRRIPADFHAIESLFAIIVLGTISLLPFYLAETSLYKAVLLGPQTFLVVIALALLVSSIGMLMWNRGNQLIGANRAAMYVNLLPLFGALLAFFFLDETITFYHIVGGIFICCGMWLALRQL
jgi:drug/metabolite transporter (DMT)-like permease